MIDEKQLTAELEKWREEKTRTHRERLSGMAPIARERSKATLTGIVETIAQVKELIKKPKPSFCPGGCGEVRTETGGHHFWTDYDEERPERRAWCSGYPTCPICKGGGFADDKNNPCETCKGSGRKKPEPVECNGNGVRDDCPEDCECRKVAAKIAANQTGDEKVLPY